MHCEGTLTSWNDERGFGRIESGQGGEPIFVHISSWPRGSARPRVGQSVSFEMELGLKGKRAKNVKPVEVRHRQQQSEGATRGQWGGATLFAIPAFLAVYAVVATIWKPPGWVAFLYLGLCIATFIAYAWDKSAANHGARRTPESTLHMLALAGGWPGALIAQQFLRHKSTKQSFRQVFRATAMVNVVAFILFASPLRRAIFPAL